MNIYEDELQPADTSVLGFLQRNKQLVWTALAFVVAYAVMSHTSTQMDEFAARDKLDQAAELQRANPGSVDHQ